jgi:hypothetical protein
MEIETKEADGSLVLMVRGEVTIEHAAPLREELIKAFGKSDRVVLNVSEVTDAQLPLLQLVCSAHRHSIRAGKAFCVPPSRSGAFVRAAADAGLVRHVGCSVDVNDTCIWVGGESQCRR